VVARRTTGLRTTDDKTAGVKRRVIGYLLSVIGKTEYGTTGFGPRTTRPWTEVQGLNPIRGLGGGAGRAGGSMMSMTRCKIVTMTAS